jgi:four helix bundle protein
MKGQDIAERLVVFAVRALDVVRRLERDSVGRHVARQLLRSASAGGANYEESRAAESRADFVHKVSIAAKELRESRYWLRLASAAKLAPQSNASEPAPFVRSPIPSSLLPVPYSTFPPPAKNLRRDRLNALESSQPSTLCIELIP